MKQRIGILKAIGLLVIIVVCLFEEFFVFLCALFNDPAPIVNACSSAGTSIFDISNLVGLPIWKSVSEQGSTKTSHIRPVVDPPITIEAKVTLSQYRKLVFVTAYTSPVFISLHFIGIAFIAFNRVRGNANWLVFYAAIYMLIMPIIIYLSGKRPYDSKRTLHERVTYTFTPECIIAKGETYHLTQKWEALHNIEETKHWFLLYLDVQNALLIPKKGFHSPADLERFKKMAKIK